MHRNTGNRFFSFLKSLTVFTFFLGLIVISVFNLFPGIAMPSKAIAVFIILYVITAVGHYLLILANQRSPQKRIILTIISITLKLFIYAVFAFLLILADKPNATGNVVLFFTLYIFYTIFELSISYLMLTQKE